MPWYEDAWDSVTETYDDVSDAVGETVDDATESVSSWLGDGPNTSDAASAEGGDALHDGSPDSWWGQVGQSVGDFGRGIQQEGIGGLLDADGMMDRQRAQRQLSDRFQVVGEDFEGERADNQVTQEEYEEIARTFSNVRMGRGDLTIDSSDFSPFAQDDRQDWEQGIQANLADMMMTEGGRDQINALSNNVSRDDQGNSRNHLWGYGPEIHHDTTITPLFGEQVTDASGKTEWQDPGWFGRDASTLRHDNAFAAPQGSGSRRDASTMERGSGTDSELRINPGSILGLRSDVVMSHEMQHAIHQTQGTNGVGNFGSGPDTNIRNSERQAVGLSRSDTPTGGHYPGDPDGCTENTYRQQRNALGDRFLPRTQYSGLPGEAPANMSDEDLQKLWDQHNTGPNVSPSL